MLWGRVVGDAIERFDQGRDHDEAEPDDVGLSEGERDESELWT